MAETKDNKKEDAQLAARRKACVMISLGMIAIAVIILLIVVMWRFFSPSQPQVGGKKWRSRGGSCGCMAGQV